MMGFDRHGEVVVVLLLLCWAGSFGNCAVGDLLGPHTDGVPGSGCKASVHAHAYQLLQKVFVAHKCGTLPVLVQCW